jgi:hypothetical protein|tara:strand:- start:168 stop:431 length:264 start_codon:yes stop_codon:yes gene_type:complete
MVVSFYVNLKGGHSSLVKFGSYDQSGIQKNSQMRLFKTASVNTWTLRANSFFVGDKRIEIARDRYVSLEPQLPFLYIPDSDFSKFRE